MNSSSGPHLGFRDAEGNVQYIGQIKPFKPENYSDKSLNYLLCGLPVKLEWRYNDVSRVLASSQSDAQRIFDLLGLK